MTLIMKWFPRYFNVPQIRRRKCTVGRRIAMQKLSTWRVTDRLQLHMLCIEKKKKRINNSSMEMGVYISSTKWTLSSYPPPPPFEYVRCPNVVFAPYKIWLASKGIDFYQPLFLHYLSVLISFCFHFLLSYTAVDFYAHAVTSGPHFKSECRQRAEHRSITYNSCPAYIDDRLYRSLLIVSV